MSAMYDLDVAVARLETEPVPQTILPVTTLQFGLTTARSGFPSPLKSAAATEMGSGPVAASSLANKFFCAPAAGADRPSTKMPVNNISKKIHSTFADYWIA